MVDPIELTLTCPDAYKISASLFMAPNPIAGVMIAPATGIKKTFYYAFAQFLVSHNFSVICYENRGIGNSNHKPEKGQELSLVTWGQQDMTAVFKELTSHVPNVSYHIVGHSAGGQLLGLMEGANEIKSMFNVASSSGKIANMKQPFKAKAYFFLNVFTPISNFLFGKSNNHWIGMGEPLPPKVAKQWAKWCNTGGYVEAEFGEGVISHSYYDLTLPIYWFHTTDDDIANLENVKDMARVFKNAQSYIHTLIPKEAGFNFVGHMKFFSNSRQSLWNYALNFLLKNV